MNDAVKERKRSAPSTPGRVRDEVLESVERLRRAATGPAYVEPDVRQLELLGGAR